jgi:hypothetical protein
MRVTIFFVGRFPEPPLSLELSLDSVGKTIFHHVLIPLICLETILSEIAESIRSRRLSRRNIATLTRIDDDANANSNVKINGMYRLNIAKVRYEDGKFLNTNSSSPIKKINVHRHLLSVSTVDQLRGIIESSNNEPLMVSAVPGDSLKVSNRKAAGSLQKKNHPKVGQQQHKENEVIVVEESNDPTNFSSSPLSNSRSYKKRAKKNKVEKEEKNSPNHKHHALDNEEESPRTFKNKIECLMEKIHSHEQDMHEQQQRKSDFHLFDNNEREKMMTHILAKNNELLQIVEASHNENLQLREQKMRDYKDIISLKEELQRQSDLEEINTRRRTSNNDDNSSKLLLQQQIVVVVESLKKGFSAELIKEPPYRRSQTLKSIDELLLPVQLDQKLPGLSSMEKEKYYQEISEDIHSLFRRLLSDDETKNDALMLRKGLTNPSKTPKNQQQQQNVEPQQLKPQQHRSSRRQKGQDPIIVDNFAVAAAAIVIQPTTKTKSKSSSSQNQLNTTNSKSPTPTATDLKTTTTTQQENRRSVIKDQVTANQISMEKRFEKKKERISQ